MKEDLFYKYLNSISKFNESIQAKDPLWDNYYKGRLNLEDKLKIKDNNHFYVLNLDMKYNFFFKTDSFESMQKIYKFLQDNKDKHNIFICLSSYYWNNEKSRKSEFCKYRNVLCFDFDNVSSEVLKDKESIMSYLYSLNKGFFEVYKPRFIVKSGHGFHLYYALESPIFCNNDNEWELYIKAFNLFASLFPIDKATKDKARLIRLPGSINQKPNKPKIETELFYNNDSDKINLKGFIECLESFGAAIKEDPIKTTTSQNKAPKKANKAPKTESYIYELTDTRKELIKAHMDHTTTKTKRELYKLWLKTLKDLIEIRNKEGIKEGYRDKLLMTLTRININNFTSQNEALRLANEYNNMFICPLTEQEVLNIVNVIYEDKEKAFIKFSSAFSIQSFLMISPTEQDLLGYDIAFFKEINNYKSLLCHKAKRQEQKTREILLGIDNNKELKRLAQFQILEDNQGASLNQLQELLNTTRKTVIKIKKEYEEYKKQQIKRA